MNALTEIGEPTDSDDYNVVTGLTQAVEELCKPSELQTQMRAADETSSVENRGRIIVLMHGKRSIYTKSISLVN